MPETIVIGAGPAGLTAAYMLSKERQPVVVLEADPDYVGGISRTVRHNGVHFDIGGHRFFSKTKEIEDLWSEILGPELLSRPRLSRIYYNGKFFAYPLKPLDAFWKLGPIEAALSIASYARARLAPVRPPASLEDWVTNQFGRRLYRMFFKTYTEKVWGMSCREISADWAAQRIKGLSLASAIRNALLPRRGRGEVVKSLIESFRYPRLGPGMMWNACADAVARSGGQVLLGHPVVRCSWREGRWEVVAANGAVFRGDHLISSAPLRELARMLDPALPEGALAAAAGLRYRDFISVGLILKGREEVPDNWIYVHDPKLRAGRIQVPRSWSPELVPDPTLGCFNLEYFCFEGDAFWSMADADIIALASKELAATGLAGSAPVIDGCVIRQKKAYPVYAGDYTARVERIRLAIEAQFPSLQLVGRNGMHKYNNQDHAMMTAMLAARNILAGERRYDLWKVNQDAEYHEEG